MKYLDYIVGKTGIQVNPSKIKAIDNWEILKTISDVRSFLGLANYYQRFIQNYSTIAAPLTSLTKKGAILLKDWTKTQQNAFEALKRKIGEKLYS